ncbi:MAG: transglutaminase-like domain-containing protein [Cyclobacteriaceae bacterium]
MQESELKALVSLLDDDDSEVSYHVEQQITSLGSEVIPFLEAQWEQSFNPEIQRRIEDLIHSLQYELLNERLLTWANSKDQDLLEGMWIIATYLYPDLELAQLKKEVEQIYYEVWTEFKNELSPVDQIKILNGVLFSKLKFKANTKNFHSPSNSMINIVLDSKRGNPITLCTIYMLVAQKLGMPVYGVNLPNMFILVYKTEEISFYINAFNRGLVFTKEDIDHYLQNINVNPDKQFYEPCENIEFIKRSFRNLAASFEKLGEYEKMEEVKVLLNLISDEKV